MNMTVSHLWKKTFRPDPIYVYIYIPAIFTTCCIALYIYIIDLPLSPSCCELVCPIGTQKCRPRGGGEIRPSKNDAILQLDGLGAKISRFASGEFGGDIGGDSYSFSLPTDSKLRADDIMGRGGAGVWN